MRAAASRPMMPDMPLTARSLGGVAFGLFVGAWLGRAMFIWILDLSRTWEIVARRRLPRSSAAVLCLAGRARRGGKRQRASG